MKRTNKFRGFNIISNKWVYGSLLKIGDNYHIVGDNDMYEDGHHIRQESDFPTWVDPKTIGQFTGRLDKEGKEIYDGDMVEYYELDSFCINPDCEPHLRGYGTILRKRTEEVVYEDCTFGIDYDTHIQCLAGCGLIEEDIEWMKEQADEDVYFDANGFAIDESILGIKVVGNIHEKKGGDDMKRVDKCCGGCNHFKYEATDGSGWCEVGDTKTYCGFGTDCNDFEDEETIRRERVARKEHESYGKSSCRNRR